MIISDAACMVKLVRFSLFRLYGKEDAGFGEKNPSSPSLVTLFCTSVSDQQ